MVGRVRPGEDNVTESFDVVRADFPIVRGQTGVDVGHVLNEKPTEVAVDYRENVSKK